MDNTNKDDKRLDLSIKAVRTKKSKESSAKSEKVEFCGDRVDKHSIQSSLDKLDPEARSKVIELDACHRFTDRMHMIMNAAYMDDEPDQHLKEDAKSIAYEWGGVIGMEDLIDDEYDEEEGLDWVNEKYLNLLFKQKQSYNKLFNED